MTAIRAFRWAVPAAALAWAFPALAQQSGRFKLDEHVLNAGGRPADGVVLTSARFRVTLDSIGEAFSGRGLSSPSFHMNTGFPQSYPPPGEVTGLRFSDGQTLWWDPEKSVGDYNVYRDLIGNLPGLSFGICALQDLPDETATDAGIPPAGAAYFYLVTAENPLDEEGTKGFQSDGLERGGNVCP